MKNKLSKILTLALIPILLAENVSAHCPLCVIGAGAAAAGATWLGVKEIVVGLFIGAFAMAMGLWFAKIIKKKYIPYQSFIITALVFLSTIIPIIAIITSEHNFYPLYIFLFGDYGSLLNRTYLIGKPLLTSLLGGLLVFSAPSLSKKISKLRGGKIIAFQGVFLTLLLLFVVGAIFQILI